MSLRTVSAGSAAEISMYPYTYIFSMAGILGGASGYPAGKPITHFIGSDTDTDGADEEVPGGRGTLGGGGTAEAGGTVKISGAAILTSGAGGAGRASGAAELSSGDATQIFIDNS